MNRTTDRGALPGCIPGRDGAGASPASDMMTGRSRDATMTTRTLSMLAGLIAATFAFEARGDMIAFRFNGAGVSGSIVLTYGPTTDAKYPQAYEVTGISGTFTDTNNGLNIVDAQIGGLVAINRATPDATNLLAPRDFSRFAVATGLPAQSNGSLSYDNLLWPGGSLPTATDYQVHGGILDIYGLLFTIGNGRVGSGWGGGDAAIYARPPAPFGVASGQAVGRRRRARAIPRPAAPAIPQRASDDGSGTAAVVATLSNSKLLAVLEATTELNADPVKLT